MLFRSKLCNKVKILYKERRQKSIKKGYILRIWLSSQQILKIEIVDILGIINIINITDITNIATDITDIAIGITDIVNIAGIAVEINRYI